MPERRRGVGVGGVVVGPAAGRTRIDDGWSAFADRSSRRTALASKTAEASRTTSPDLLAPKAVGERAHSGAQRPVAAALVREEVIHLEPDVAEMTQEEEQRAREDREQGDGYHRAVRVGQHQRDGTQQQAHPVQHQHRLAMGQPEPEQAMVNVLLVGAEQGSPAHRAPAHRQQRVQDGQAQGDDRDQHRHRRRRLLVGLDGELVARTKPRNMLPVSPMKIDAGLKL